MSISNFKDKLKAVKRFVSIGLKLKKTAVTSKITLKYGIIRFEKADSIESAFLFFSYGDNTSLGGDYQTHICHNTFKFIIISIMGSNGANSTGGGVNR